MASLAGALRPAPAPAAQNVAIDIRGVNHTFNLRGSDLPVLDSINLSVAAGEFVALLGPSGCGKSTLLRLVSGLDQPTEGSITADGEIGPAPRRPGAVQQRAPLEHEVGDDALALLLIAWVRCHRSICSPRYRGTQREKRHRRQRQSPPAVTGLHEESPATK